MCVFRSPVNSSCLTFWPSRMTSASGGVEGQWLASLQELVSTSLLFSSHLAPAFHLFAPNFPLPLSSSCVAVFQSVGGVPVSDGREDESPGHRSSWNCCPHWGTVHTVVEDPAGKTVTAGKIVLIQSFSETPKRSVSEDLSPCKLLKCSVPPAMIFYVCTRGVFIFSLSYIP